MILGSFLPLNQLACLSDVAPSGRKRSVNLHGGHPNDLTDIITDILPQVRGTLLSFFLSVGALSVLLYCPHVYMRDLRSSDSQLLNSTTKSEELY